MTISRGAGGNRFIAADSDRTMLAAAIMRGLRELDEWARDTGRTFDAGAVTVETKRVRSGLISVSVTGDLIAPDRRSYVPPVTPAERVQGTDSEESE